MNKIFKKALTLALSATMCLTAFVGCLTVNAEGTAKTGTVTVADVTAEAGAEVKVDVTVKSTEDANEIAAALIGVTFDKEALKLTDVEGTAYDADMLTENGSKAEYAETETGAKVLVEAMAMDHDMPAELTATLVFAVDADANGKYDVAIDTNVMQAGTAGTKATLNGITYASDEQLVTLTATNGSVTVGTAVETLTGMVGYEVIVDANIGLLIKVLQAKVASYDHYELCISNKAYNISYDLEERSKTLTKEDISKIDNATGFDCYRYTDVSLYAMDQDLVYYVACYDANGVLKARTKDITKNIATLVKDTIKSKANSNVAKDKAQVKFLVDLLNYADEAQTYFAKKNPTSELADRVNSGETLLNGMDSYMQYASADTAENIVLNPKNESVRDDSYSKSDLNMGKYLVIRSSNVIEYRFLLSDTIKNTKPTVKFTYTNSYNRTDELEVAVDSMNINANMPAYLYDKIAMYDIHVPIKTEVISDGKTILSNEYNFESMISSNIAIEANQNLLLKFARLGHSSYNYVHGVY